MQFEWDPIKSAANLEKHRIDFESAKCLWNDPDRVEIVAPHPLENRYIVIARIGTQLWSTVYTVREGTIRIISVRRSRKQEKELYDQEKIRQEQ
jgi:uncharacterized DUF497 family protein